MQHRALEVATFHPLVRVNIEVRLNNFALVKLK